MHIRQPNQQAWAHPELFTKRFEAVSAGMLTCTQHNNSIPANIRPRRLTYGCCTSPLLLRRDIQTYYPAPKKRETSGSSWWPKVLLDKGITNRTIGQNQFRSIGFTKDHGRYAYWLKRKKCPRNGIFRGSVCSNSQEYF